MTPIPQFARMQMTVSEKKARIAELHRIDHALVRERVTLQLEVEEEEGRSDGYQAKWCRAWLSGDMAECDRLLEDQYPKEVRS
jgi:hypothetical protein